MKIRYQLAICFFLMFSFGATAQVWTTIISTPNDELGNCAITLPNGDFLIGGAFNGPGDYFSTRNLLIRTDGQGNVMWQKLFGLTDNEGSYTHSEAIVKMRISNDGNVLILGSRLPIGPNNFAFNDFYLAKFTPDGEELWRKYYNYGGADWAKAFVQTLDGGYAVVGYTTSFGGSGNSDIFLSKFRVDGEQDWVKYFDKNAVDDCGDILMTSTGNFIITGTSQFQGMGNRLYFIATDPNGNLLWEKSHLGPETVNVFSASMMQDGSFIVTGNGSSGVSSLAPMTAKFNEVGELKWVANCTDCLYGENYGIVQCQEGGSISVGMGGDSPFDGFILQQLDPSGNEVLAQTIFPNTAEIEFGKNIIWDADGGVVLLGNRLGPDNGYDILLMKQEGLDCTPSEYVSAVPERDEKAVSALVSPNPTSGIFSIKLSSEEMVVSGILQLQDAMGRLIYQQQVDGLQDVSMDGSCLPNGIYFLSLRNENTAMQLEKVVIAHD